MPECAAAPSRESKYMKGFTSAAIIVPVKLAKTIFLIVISCCGELLLRFGFFFSVHRFWNPFFAYAGDVLVWVWEMRRCCSIHARGEPGWFALRILVQLDGSVFECRVNALWWKSKQHAVPGEEIQSCKALSACWCSCPLNSLSS